MQALELNITPQRWLRAKLAGGLLGDRAFRGRWGVLALRDLPEPALPGDDWVRCKTILGGICGTDLAIVHLRQRPDSILQGFGSMPMVLGHENVAKVVDVGPAVGREWLGKRVCVEPTLCCRVRGIDPPCKPCAAGAFGACENFGAGGEGAYGLPNGTSIGYNARTGGSWGEQFVAHVSQLIEPPAGLTNEQAVLTDPLACSAHAVLRADLAEAGWVLILGGGMMGLGVAACLRAAGYDGAIDLMARHGFQQEWVRTHANAGKLPPGEPLDVLAQHIGLRIVPARMGAKMLSGGYDVIFDCAGSAKSFDLATKAARARGQVLLVGTAGKAVMDPTPIWFSELQVLGVYGRAFEQVAGRRISTYQLVHEWMAAGTLPTDGLLTHTFPIADWPAALAAAADKAPSGCIKAAFQF